MENASKALITAGAILIAILIISLGVLIFSKFGGAAKDAANMDEQEIASFNSKITPYIGNTISGSQVNALLQYCLSVNMAAKQANESDVKAITIQNYPITGGTWTIDENSITFKRVETGGRPYKVESEYDDNGLIRKITITRP